MTITQIKNQNKIQISNYLDKISKDLSEGIKKKAINSNGSALSNVQKAISEINNLKQAVIELKKYAIYVVNASSNKNAKQISLEVQNQINQNQISAVQKTAQKQSAAKKKNTNSAKTKKAVSGIKQAQSKVNNQKAVSGIKQAQSKANNQKSASGIKQAQSKANNQKAGNNVSIKKIASQAFNKSATNFNSKKKAVLAKVIKAKVASKKANGSKKTNKVRK